MKKKLQPIKPGEFGAGELGRKFRLKNYKSFKNEIEFYLPKFTLFIGPNNSGKSTLSSWFNLLKSNWRNLDPSIIEDKYFNEVLNRNSKEDCIEYTYYLQLNINKEIEVKLIYKNDNTKTSLGGESLNTGLLDKAIIYFDNKLLFEIDSYEYFDPENGKIKINIKNLVKLLKNKQIKVLKDNIADLADPYDFKELYFDLDEELNKLKKFPDLIEITLSHLFFGTYNNEKQIYFDLDEYGKILNIQLNGHFQLQIHKLLRSVINGASLTVNEYISVKKDEDYLWKVNIDEFRSIHISKDFEEIHNLTGLKLRLLTIKDDNGKFYGHKIQIYENNEWIYLDSIGQGYRSFINILINYKISSSNFSDYKFFFIEEPENTLHPDLIVKFLNLLTSIINSDIHSRNFIIETHSLIILKYFQLAIAKGILKPEDVNIYEFSKGEDLCTEVSRKTIDKHGFLSSDFSNGFTNHVLDMEMELWRIQQSLINKN